jgi:RNA polymerase primary sigma factor
MTSAPPPDDQHDALFIADFHPELGADLARRHASGYDAVAGRARFLLWLAAHADGVDALTDYLARVARIPRLTAAEEVELATAVQAGRQAQQRLAHDGDALAGQARADLARLAQDGTEAGNRLLEANLRLVVAVARLSADRGVPYSDLVQEGTIGLIRAVQKYDHTKGVRFDTYATWWIRQAINRAAADQRRDALAAEPKARAADELALTERLMLQLLGREPTPEELAAELDLSATTNDPAPRSAREQL